jgi:hypothetical protein
MGRAHRCANPKLPHTVPDGFCVTLFVGIDETVDPGVDGPYGPQVSKTAQPAGKGSRGEDVKLA